MFGNRNNFVILPKIGMSLERFLKIMRLEINLRHVKKQRLSVRNDPKESMAYPKSWM